MLDISGFSMICGNKYLCAANRPGYLLQLGSDVGRTGRRWQPLHTALPSDPFISGAGRSCSSGKTPSQTQSEARL